MNRKYTLIAIVSGGLSNALVYLISSIYFIHRESSVRHTHTEYLFVAILCCSSMIIYPIAINILKVGLEELGTIKPHLKIILWSMTSEIISIFIGILIISLIYLAGKPMGIGDMAFGVFILMFWGLASSIYIVPLIIAVILIGYFITIILASTTQRNAKSQTQA